MYSIVFVTKKARIVILNVLKIFKGPWEGFGLCNAEFIEKLLGIALKLTVTQSQTNIGVDT